MVSLLVIIAEKQTYLSRNSHCWMPPSITQCIWVWRHGHCVTFHLAYSPTELKGKQRLELRYVSGQSLCGPWDSTHFFSEPCTTSWASRSWRKWVIPSLLQDISNTGQLPSGKQNNCYCSFQVSQELSAVNPVLALCGCLHRATLTSKHAWGC